MMQSLACYAYYILRNKYRYYLTHLCTNSETIKIKFLTLASRHHSCLISDCALYFILLHCTRV